MDEQPADRYERIERIAAGGAGEVWSARDLSSGDVVAIKILRAAHAKALLRFTREQSLGIRHPHVMTPLGWAVARNRMLFAMPLARGGSVATLVGDYGALPVRYSAELLRQLLDGLAAVHAAGVLHRDVKPANLLLDPTGIGRPRLRLSDFGVALPLGEPRLTTMAAVVGTPGYVAPEQRYGADPAPAQDLYAVGVVARHLLTGARPHEPGFDANDGPLRDLVARLCDADPARRPTLTEARAALEGPDLAWQDQDAIEVFEVIDADGHLAGADPDPEPPSQVSVSFAPTAPRRP